MRSSAPKICAVPSPWCTSQSTTIARPEYAFYLAGADPWEGDRLGRLALSKAGLLARDELVLDGLLEAGAAVCVVLAGGYADDVRDTVDIHAATAAAVAGRTHVLTPG